MERRWSQSADYNTTIWQIDFQLQYFWGGKLNSVSSKFLFLLNINQDSQESQKLCLLGGCFVASKARQGKAESCLSVCLSVCQQQQQNMQLRLKESKQRIQQRTSQKTINLKVLTLKKWSKIELVDRECGIFRMNSISPNPKKMKES